MARIPRLLPLIAVAIGGVVAVRAVGVAPGLFDAIVNRCVEPNRMCMRDAMAIDAQGGAGIPGAHNLTTLDPQTRERLGLTEMPPRKYVGAMCTASEGLVL